MKIFSYKSKAGLLVWSMFLALIVLAVLYFFSQEVATPLANPRDIYTNCVSAYTNCLSAVGPANSVDFGWPFKFYDVTQYAFGATYLYQLLNLYDWILDFLFWTLVFFIILIIYTNFRKPKVQKEFIWWPKENLLLQSTILGVMVSVLLVVLSGGVQKLLGSQLQFTDFGWPAPFHLYGPVVSLLATSSAGYLSFWQGFLINLLFWVLMSYIILGSIKYFRK